MQQPKEERYTLADAMTWNEDERMELIGGAPVMMVPPSRAHQKIVGELFAQIHGYLEGKRCEAYVAPFAVRPFEEDGGRPENVDTMVEPDITVVCSVTRESWTTSDARERRILSRRFCHPPASGMTAW